MTVWNFWVNTTTITLLLKPEIINSKTILKRWATSSQQTDKQVGVAGDSKISAHVGQATNRAPHAQVSSAIGPLPIVALMDSSNVMYVSRKCGGAPQIVGATLDQSVAAWATAVPWYLVMAELLHSTLL